MHFGAQSRGLRAPCERFAPWVTPGPRITRFRLAADLGRMGLDTHRVSNKVSKITSCHLVPLDRAFPGTRVGARLDAEPATGQLSWRLSFEGGRTPADRARSSDSRCCMRAGPRSAALLTFGLSGGVVARLDADGEPSSPEHLRDQSCRNRVDRVQSSDSRCCMQSTLRSVALPASGLADHYR